MSEAQYKHISVHRVAGALGASIEGVDLSRPLRDEVFGEIRLALQEHLVLFFRGQVLDVTHHASFAERLGPLIQNAYAVPVEGQSFVVPVLREAEEKASVLNTGGYWHGDAPYLDRPAYTLTLYAVDVPPFGGDTMFANCITAYEALSCGMKAMCDRLIVIHSAGGVINRGLYGAQVLKADAQVAAAAQQAEHPLVREHPDSGRKGLFLSGPFVIRFKDMTEAESEPLLDYLNQHISKPEFTCRHTWARGDFCVLDNRFTQHFAINDYSGHKRLMHRLNTIGERPFGPAMPTH